MYRIGLLFFLLFSLLHAEVAIDKKIKTTSSKLNSYSANYQKLNKKMAQTANAILLQKKKLMQQNRYLQNLKEDLKNKESIYSTSTKTLLSLQKKQKLLKQKQEKLGQDLVFVIAKSVSLSVMLSDEYPVNKESLIEFEVLKSMLQKSKQKAKKLNGQFFKNSQVIASLNEQTTSLQKAISAIDKKRKKVLKLQAENKKALKKLTLAKASYKKELQNLLQRQNALKKTLAKLNLIKIDAIRRAQEKKEREAAFRRQKIAMKGNIPAVKQHGSSYQNVPTVAYTGVKTIAPLRRYSITKRYGPYVDPIYGIKIFNESISLKPKESNAKVKTVFNGRVIYADKTAVLNNIVIVEHKNGLHTIYANLSQIAPGIKKGKRIRKGAVIGRVKNELVFEVTQKNAHINPIRLFR